MRQKKTRSDAKREILAVENWGKADVCSNKLFDSRLNIMSYSSDPEKSEHASCLFCFLVVSFICREEIIMAISISESLSLGQQCLGPVYSWY